MTCLVIAVLAAGQPERVSLDGQRATLSSDGERPQLELSMRVKSRLPIAIEEVEIGVLFAAAPEPIEAADAGRLYEGARSQQVGALRFRERVLLPPGGELPLTLRADLPTGPGAPEARTFVTHVLDYRLAELRAPLLMELLGTDVAADEGAAAGSLGLVGGPAAKRRVRERFGADAALVGALVEIATAPVPEKPSQLETNSRLLAILGLGVLGGDAAREALRTLAARDDLSAFDAGLEVVRVARLLGTSLENALAHTLDPDARSMRDALEQAERDLAGWPEEPTAAPATATASSAQVPSPDEQPSSGGVALIATGLVVALGAGLLLRLRRRTSVRQD